MTRVDPEIAWYYGRGREAARLATDCRLEEERTRRILARRLPAPPAAVVDVGGGPGAYAVGLAGLGHTVHLVDPIALHLEQAKDAAARADVRLAGLHEAAADELPFDDGTFEVALLLGPLYHLTERARRVAALREARRVLRPDGTVFSAAISRYASAVDGFFRNHVESDEFAEIMRRDVAEGQHRNPGRRPGWFTTSYFHHPDELRAEHEEAGFGRVELIAIEGPWSCIPDLDRKWDDERFRSLLLDTIESMESDPSVLGLGGHLMAVGRIREDSGAGLGPVRGRGEPA